MKRLLGFLAIVAALVVLVLAAVAFGVRRTLPPDDESRTLAELSGLADAPITLEYDALGVPTIRAASDEAMAFGQGYAHARDRRFQMELFRRNAAGRLCELVGPSALPLDRRMRQLGVPRIAEAAAAGWSPSRRRIFAAYAAGVNAYDRTHSAPPEILLLGAKLEPWRPSDCALVHFLMIDDLNSEAIDQEIAREQEDASLPPSLVAFLHPLGTPGDVVLDGSAALAEPPLPGASVVDLRATKQARATARPVGTLVFDPLDVGSNNWAVGPSRTATGGALLAGDPHQGLSVPTLYHRERLLGAGLSITGIALPGVPGIVFGSNGAVAWSGTNVEGDFADLVRVEPADAETTTWKGPNGPEPFTVTREIIAVRGAPAETLVTRSTRFGPVIAPSAIGGLLCVQWVAFDPTTYDMELYPLDRARSVRELFAALDSFRAPALNFVAADSSGSIGWAIGGRVPARGGYDPSRPRDGADSLGAWSGWLGRDALPAVIDPPSGVLTTANQRTLAAASWARLGGDPAMPWRARRILGRLYQRSNWTAEALAEMQNDVDDAFLTPTAETIAQALTPESIASDDTLARVKQLLDGRKPGADTTSVVHAYLREARAQIASALIDPLVAPVRVAHSRYRYTWGLADEVVRRMLLARAPNLLDPSFEDYDALVRACARRAAAVLATKAPGVPFDRVTWGRVNRARFHHPLGDAIPPLGKWLDYPDVALAGGSSCIRVARPKSGAAMRLVADLEDASKSRFALPGGQSGNFLSKHYSDGFAGWVAGTTTALEPGPGAHRITLTPAKPASR